MNDLLDKHSKLTFNKCTNKLND